MLKYLFLMSSYWLAMPALAEIAARQPTPLHKQLRLVGFIRVGPSDKQSLVVLKTVLDGRTMILRPEDLIPGTEFRILRLERDELIVNGPSGQQSIPLETSAEVVTPGLGGGEIIAEAEIVDGESHFDRASTGAEEPRPESSPDHAGSHAEREGEGEGRVEKRAAQVEVIKLQPASVSFEGQEKDKDKEKDKDARSEMPCLDESCRGKDESKTER